MKSMSRWFVPILFILGIGSALLAQPRPQKNAWPDSLQAVTLTGTVIIDTTHQNIYFLDVNGDGAPDYNLAFGPDWYEPASGAERPEAGDQVTVVGAINLKPVVPVVIVFEINGLLWRPAVENWWRHAEWCDSAQVITVTGTVLIDTTYFYAHYYLDSDGDQLPNYQLCFGPPWYEPASGATRPAAGITVTIEGVEKGTPSLPCLEVLTIDGLVWRELQGPAPWSGGWISKHHRQARRIHCPVDSSSWVEIPPGAWQGSGHGPQFPDSIYCEFMKVWRDSLPNSPDSAIVGWHFHFSNPAGNPVNGKGVPVRFIKRLRLQFRYAEGDSGGWWQHYRRGAMVQLRYWDENLMTWLPINDASYDLTHQVVVFETESIQSYYAVFVAESSTSSSEIRSEQPASFDLQQNYPNPFNPTTTISYQLQHAVQVRLSILNLLGTEVRVLTNQFQPAGTYRVVWDGRDQQGQLLPTGYYLYRLQVGDMTQVRRMLLMK
ncbi:MAG: T9SS type A sorting domain-containing protein [candidate division KSB1 bacterium]|nr:T9SS type A sorting domain-containing protein [candidate division KSB1 bacterium]